MDHKEHLTNEKLGGKFTNQFDLVNYAIKLAENMVKSGRAPRVKCDIQNPAVIILEEITVGKDHFDEIGTNGMETEAAPHTTIQMRDIEKKKSAKETDKKKGKKRFEKED